MWKTIRRFEELVERLAAAAASASHAELHLRAGGLRHYEQWRA